MRKITRSRSFIAIGVAAIALGSACSSANSSADSGLGGFRTCASDTDCADSEGCMIEVGPGSGYCSPLCDANAECPAKFACPSAVRSEPADCDGKGRHRGRGVCDQFKGEFTPATCANANPAPPPPAPTPPSPVDDGGRPPTSADAGMELTATAIPTLRNPAASGHPAMGSTVRIAGAVVTGVKAVGNSHGFWVQAPGVTAWAGLYVFVGAAAPTVSVGDVVSATGVYGAFLTQEQLDVRSGTYEHTSTSSVPSPIDVSPTEINDTGARAAELESMLVRIKNVRATSATVGVDFRVEAAIAPAGTLVVTSFSANDTGPSPFPATQGAAFSSITGHGSVFGTARRRIAPRSASDVVPW